MRYSPRLVTLGAFVLAALLSVLAAIWSATAIESRSASTVRLALVEGGFDWAKVGTDGLQVILSGTAPSESLRFRAIATTGEVVDPARVVDAMNVETSDSIAPPDYSVEILRNAEGVSLIGLVPADTDREGMVASLAEFAGEDKVTDLLGTARHPVPETWAPALDYALASLKSLPRAKISVEAGRVSIMAISDSSAEKAKLETDLRRRVPDGVEVKLDISAPRPVITPFSLRFVMDDRGGRFDSCSADSEAARDKILAAAVAAGAERKLTCTIGLGVPSPAWQDAVVLALGAVAEMGAGTLTFADADITLVVPSTVQQAAYDRAVGRLESNLPEVFSLKVTRLKDESAPEADAGAPEFAASRAEDGKVLLTGRIPDQRTRDAVENFARAIFGNTNVLPAMRVAEGLPQGWPVRVLAGVEALGEVRVGTVTIAPDSIRIEGVTGASDASDKISRMLAGRLGGDARISISVRYDSKFDPQANMPTAEDCERDLNAVLGQSKITFEPGKAIIAPSAKATLDKLAEVMKRCSDFPMEVAGHTDAQGSAEMNLKLSQQRAEAVIQALMDRRVLTAQLTAKGYGEDRPLGENETEAGREANRRIEFMLIKPEDLAAAAAGIVVLKPASDTIRPKKRPRQPGEDGIASGEGSGDALPGDQQTGSGDGPAADQNGDQGGPADAD